MNEFIKADYDKAFKKSVAALGKAEHVTKETLKELSRDVLHALHNTGDIGYVNAIINVLTPVNKRVAVLYFKAFTGFTWEEQGKTFGKKNKKLYDACVALSYEFLEDPNNNIWSWAERNIEVETKPFDLAKVSQFAKSALKKAEEAGITQSDVLKAFFDAGFEVDALMVLLDKLGYDAKVE